MFTPGPGPLSDFGPNPQVENNFEIFSNRFADEKQLNALSIH